MILKKIVLVFCLFWIVGIFVTCDMDTPENGYFIYVFNNQAKQTVTIELNQPYRLNLDKTDDGKYKNSEKTEPLNIQAGRSTEVYVSKDSVDFKWKVGNRTDNLEVYCEKDGSKAIFMEREIGGYYNYEFDNQTGYTISVTMNQPYKISKNSTERNNALSINARSKTMVYVLQDSLDFQWTTSSGSNNSKIYSETIGAKVTFKER
jgi:hypothetical protein